MPDSRAALSFLYKKAQTLTIITCFLAVVSGTETALAASIKVIADKLDNPRGLSFGPDGSLYITEAGAGGDGPCFPSLSLQNLPSCVGTSSAITRVKDGKQERILTGLPSIALSPTGGEASGSQDIQFDRAGNPYLLIGYAANTTNSNTLPNSPGWGQLYKVDLKAGSLTSIADLSSYELVNNPDKDVQNYGGLINSNPFAFAIKGDTAYITDAAGNDVLSVGLDGSNLTTVSVLPGQSIDISNIPPALSQVIPTSASGTVDIQSVPTGVTIGPDGALYVSELTGFPIPAGEARIFRVGLNGETNVFADGFTQLTDLEFDKQGNLYVLQYANEPYWKEILEGSLIQIAPDGTRTTLVSGNGLESATALTVGPDGAIYVSSKGDRAGVGQVLRIEKTQAVPEPTSALSLLAFGTFGAASFLKNLKKTHHNS